MTGFIVFRLFEKYEEEFYEVIPSLIAKGQIK